MTESSKRLISSLTLSWILMVPILVFASGWGFSFEHGAINSAMGAHAGDTADNTPLKVQSAIVYLTCAFAMMGLTRAILVDFCSDLLLTSLPVFALLSTMWSQYPRATLVHVVLLTVNMAFAFYLLRRFSTDELLRLLLMAGTLAVIGSLFLVAVLPRYGIQERTTLTAGDWQGIFPQKNTLGFIMTQLLLPAFFVSVKSLHARISRNTYVAVVLFMILMCRSAGAWFSCASCICFVLTVRFLRRMPRKDVAAILFLLAGVAAVAGFFVYRNFVALMYAIGKDPTLTGRTIIYSSLLNSAAKRPLLGYGYTAFWGPLQGESANTAIVMHWPGMGYAENGLLELLLELGAVGFVLYALVFFRAVKDALYCLTRDPSPAVMWYASSLFYVAVTNIEAGKVLSTSELGLIFSVIAFAGLRREAQRTSSQLDDRRHTTVKGIDEMRRLAGA